MPKPSQESERSCTCELEVSSRGIKCLSQASKVSGNVHVS